MAVSSETMFLAQPPSLVIDNVSMIYRTTSRRNSQQLKGRVRKGLSMRNAVGSTSPVSVAAVKNLSLIVDHGESLGIIGRNGSGKSTLLKIVAGHFPPTSGAVYAAATPIMLGVNAALMPGLSGDQNIELGCLAMGMPMSEINRKYDSIVELSGLEEAIHMPMKAYSSGMSSRLRFAIAASIDPDILIIDEALNTGDDQFKDRTKKRMIELLEAAGTVLIVSHSLSTITELCNRVIWLDQGELLFDGAPADGVKAYRLFTQKLAAGDRVGAFKYRRRLIRDLEVANVVDRNARRRGRV